MDEKNIDPQQIADEWLEAVTGGVNANARLEVRARAVSNDETDDEGNDTSSPWIVICPNCLHTLRYCTCARR